MARIVWEYGKWDSFWGYVCGQCSTMFPFYQGGLQHEEEIDANGGVCPIKQKRDAEREQEAEE